MLFSILNVPFGEQINIVRMHSCDQWPYLFNEKKESFALQKGLSPSGLIWDTNMADYSFFRDPNMVVLTSYAYALN